MIDKLKNKLGNKKYIIIFFITTLLIQILMTITLKDVNMKEFFEMQVTISKDNFINIVNNWNPHQIKAYHIHFYFDFLYLISYSLLLFSILSYFFIWITRGKSQIASTMKYILILPFIAAFFDIIENLFHIYFINSNYNVSNILFPISGIFSIQKWILIALILYVIALLFFKLVIVHQKIKHDN
jgi:hypothetical protein